jgi:hypothetical protein
MGLPFLTGCFINDTIDSINKAKEKIEALTDPFILQGVVVGVTAIDDPQIAELLEGGDFVPGVGASVFIADATDAAEMDDAPVHDATVLIEGNLDVLAEELILDDVATGQYDIRPEDGLIYTPGARWKLKVQAAEDERVSVARFDLPEPVVGLNIPKKHTPGDDLVLDFASLEQDYLSALVFVVDDTGELTWSNEPTDINSLYAVTSAVDPLESITIPGSAFADEALYVVGVAGMVHTDPNMDLVEVNIALSSVMSGQLVFWPVTTISFP